ncbi:hypothetical protein [Arthrobacter ulcerisalmonis]|uniref:hypothetical protein n=1 Tax=Arthrobacter ulcerisalmonis TaxID=2483813 RepID=UPI00366CA5B4
MLAAAAVVISFISLAIAVRSARVNHRAAKISEWSAAVGNAYASTPPITVRLDRVSYQWANPRSDQLNPSRDERIVLAEAIRRDLFAEVLVEGTITAGDQDALLTYRDHARCGRSVWYPLMNQNVFSVGSRHNVNWSVLEAGASENFTWVDRRSAQEWANIYALYNGNLWDDPELELPQLKSKDIPQILRMVWNFRMTNQSLAMKLIREDKVARSGFRIIGESRLDRRVTVEWSAEVICSALEAFGREDPSEALLWRVAQEIPGPIDDDVIRYRANLSHVLAAIITPRSRRVPGRD